MCFERISFGSRSLFLWGSGHNAKQCLHGVLRDGPNSNPEKQLSGSKWSFGGWSEKELRKTNFWVELGVGPKSNPEKQFYGSKWSFRGWLGPLNPYLQIAPACLF